MKRSALATSVAVCGLVLGLAGTAQGQAARHPAPIHTDTVDVALPTQLPRQAIPSHYAITVTPHADRLTFDGQIAIDLKVVKATRSLTLNAADLSFSSARISGSGAAQSGTARIDAANETVTIDFPNDIAPGTHRLDLAYAGKINTQANGLFALDYKNQAGQPKRSLFTQFEAADARRFMPSWDEPDYKASFDLVARVPAGEMAVSNMPAASSRAIGGGLKEVRFRTTPTMSSYLLFFATGDFERIAKPAGGREVGIVMSRGNAAKAHTALNAEAQILPFYNQYFGVDFPLPKLDNVAGPGQSQFFGAMENWGAIFTFERILLDDPAITTEAERQSIFDVEAHEMAHQWFGDLVTMGWWSDLWLNEGFASWMANKTSRHFHPDWGGDVDQVASREAAMNLDSLATTHPIVQNISTVEQANQAFDTITYEKGESVISMLEGFATPATWQRGIQRYMAENSYRNTRTADLWAAVERAGATGLTRIADDFTRQGGVPLIRLDNAQCSNGRTTLTLSQSEFSVDRQRETSARPRRWHVPVRASAGAGVAQVVTDGPTTRLDVPGCGPLLLNPGQTGYFRTLYTPAQLEALRGAFPALSAPDQYGVLRNALALSRAGYQPVAQALDLLDAVATVPNGRVAARGISEWSDLYDAFESDPALRRQIAAFAIARYAPRLAQLGFAPRAGEAPLNAVLRQELIQDLGHMGDPRTVAEANRLTTAWLRNRNAIPGALKSTWLGVAAGNATPALWEQLHAAAAGTAGTVERTSLYRLLGTAQDPALASRALDLALTDEPGKTISAGMITGTAEGHSDLALDYVLAHLAQVNALLDVSGRSRFIGRLVESSSDEKQIARLEAYARANLAAADRRPVDQAIAQIRTRAAANKRIAPDLRSWLAAHR